MKIRAAVPDDVVKLAGLRHALWSDASINEHTQELEAYFSGKLREALEILVAEDPSDILLGFAEISIRPNAEGCTTDRVGYLEGWYVASTVRRAGIGRALLSAAEDWARTQGCKSLRPTRRSKTKPAPLPTALLTSPKSV